MKNALDDSAGDIDRCLGKAPAGPVVTPTMAAASRPAGWSAGQGSQRGRSAASGATAAVRPG